MRLNGIYHNSEVVERLLLDLYDQTTVICKGNKVSLEGKTQAQEVFKQLVWDNFSSLKNAVHLIPITTPISEGEVEYQELEKNSF